jgi:general secretion pathway protein H
MAAKVGPEVRQISKPRIDEGARGRSPQAGIVLLDIVIAMAAFALLVLLVLPSLPHETTASRLGAYAAEVAAILKSDRGAAARAGHDVATSIDVATRQIASGAGGRKLTLPEDVTLDLVASDTCLLQPGQFAVIFAADGRSCGAVISLAKNGLDWRIRINWLTGFIDVVAPERG